MSEENIEHLAKLCRIQCSEKEKLKFAENLQKVLDYIHLLDAVDTVDVPACTCVSENIFNVMEEDEVSVDFNREDFLKNAPDQIGGMIRVPPVMQE